MAYFQTDDRDDYLNSIGSLKSLKWWHVDNPNIIFESPYQHEAKKHFNCGRRKLRNNFNKTV